MNNNHDDKQEVGAPFQDELEAAEAKDKEALSQHLQYVDKLLERKRSLSVQATGLLEKIKEQRSETSIAVEEIREKGKAETLDAQALWAQGEDARREKWMAKRTQEIRELTLKGLEPEIERIMDKHKAEMEEIERGHHREAQRLRKQASLRADEALSEERARVRGRVEQARRQAMEAIGERRQALTDKHQADLERLRKRAAEEAETQRRYDKARTALLEFI
ncbi:Novel protein containing IQ calmodulin-binding motif [Ectocarpus siliculosus]|uniref:Novel protein containing IQ calmodulin-binding motif n=1 Tax=Ectocarpus siliculosus TaxID=2880 RepID=D8LNV0_ECTSI|nr:Novel protein containing IQ calmodulin-binding motif [Ectocarpus siliculosus]|eukprot:CBN78310.1 Novel protein containing IQ calmodulin-binding motif [Ectocarpus siliculosus]